MGKQLFHLRRQSVYNAAMAAEASTAKKFLIGRNTACDLLLTHRTVSNHHAEIVFTETGRIWLVDRGSSNGTYLMVDGKASRIEREIVEPEDVVRFGSFAVPVHEIIEALVAKHGPLI